MVCCPRKPLIHNDSHSIEDHSFHHYIFLSQLSTRVMSRVEKNNQNMFNAMLLFIISRLVFLENPIPIASLQTIMLRLGGNYNRIKICDVKIKTLVSPTAV